MLTTSETWPCLPFSLEHPPTSVSHSLWGLSQHSTLFLTSVASTPALHRSWLTLATVPLPALIHLSALSSSSSPQENLPSKLRAPTVPLLKCAPVFTQARLTYFSFYYYAHIYQITWNFSLGSGFLQGRHHLILFILKISPDLSAAFGTQQSHICLLSCNSKDSAPWDGSFGGSGGLGWTNCATFHHNRGRSERLRAPKGSETWLLLFR